MSECEKCGDTGWMTVEDGDGVSMKRCPCSGSTGDPGAEGSIKPRGFHVTVEVEGTRTSPGWKKTIMAEQNGQVFIASLSPVELTSLLNASSVKSWQHLAHIFEIHFLNLVAQETGVLKQRVDLLERGAKISEERHALSEKRLEGLDESRKSVISVLDAFRSKLDTLDASVLRLASQFLDLSNSIVKFLTGGSR